MKRLGWWMQYVHLTWKRRLEMHLANRTRTVWDKRRRSIDTARLSFNAALPRQGAIIRQTRRCFIARDGVATMRELRSWAYPGQPRQHWHYFSITRALRRLERSELAGAFIQHARDTANKCDSFRTITTWLADTESALLEA